MVLSAPPFVVQRTPAAITVRSPRAALQVLYRTGAATLSWPGGRSVAGITGHWTLAGGKSVAAAGAPVRVRNYTVNRHEMMVELEWPNGVTRRFWLNSDTAEVRTRLDYSADHAVKVSRIDVVQTQGALSIPHKAPLNSLFVPYDNDGYARFRSDAWGTDKGDAAGSSEVGAVYDDSTRHGLIVGALDHDTWKSAVLFHRSANGGVRSLDAYAGLAGTQTRDSQPHGAVSGRRLQSPEFVLFPADDWRDGMERYGDLNRQRVAPMQWLEGPPFGWNSWSAYKDKVSADEARSATDFLLQQLPDFRDSGTAYVNLDSYWDNLSQVQRREFVMHAHSHGLRAGIYFTPFVCWSSNLDVKVDDTDVPYRALVLKDALGNPLPKVDGGWPLDPTNPATLEHIDRQLDKFVNQGFDFVKLDFLTHGALEGRHWLGSCQTGTQAYVYGMRHIDARLARSRIGKPFFISLSIAPLFPYGLGHARRISCDAFANIGATEYLLNSATYGWWIHRRLFAFSDPDSACVYQPLGEAPDSESEGRCRLTASLVVGGMLIDSDDLTDPKAAARVRDFFSRKPLLELAKLNQAFRPVDGVSRDRATQAFELSVGQATYVAVFNYDKDKTSSYEIPFSRLGLAPQGAWRTANLWTGQVGEARRRLSVTLPPASCALLRLTRLPSH